MKARILRFQRPAARRPTSIERALYGDEIAQRERIRAQQKARPGYLRRPALAREPHENV